VRKPTGARGGALQAQAIRAERLKRSLSVNAVAERSGLSQQMVSYVEREMRGPTLTTLLRITGVLELDLGEVLKRAQREVERS